MTAVEKPHQNISSAGALSSTVMGAQQIARQLIDRIGDPDSSEKLLRAMLATMIQFEDEGDFSESVAQELERFKNKCSTEHWEISYALCFYLTNPMVCMSKMGSSELSNTWISKLSMSLYNLAASAFIKRHFVVAHKYWSIVVQYVPRNFFPHYSLALVCQFQGDWWGVRQHACRAVRIAEFLHNETPTNPKEALEVNLEQRSSAWSVLARATRELERECAEAYYQKALSIDPKNDSALRGLGKLIFKKDRTAAAKLFQRAFDLNPADAGNFANVFEVHRPPNDLITQLQLVEMCQRFSSSFLRSVPVDLPTKPINNEWLASWTRLEEAVDWLLNDRSIYKIIDDLGHFADVAPKVLGAACSLVEFLNRVESVLIEVDGFSFQKLIECLISIMATRLHLAELINMICDRNVKLSDVQRTLVVRRISWIRKQFNKRLSIEQIDLLEILEYKASAQSDDEFMRLVLATEDIWLARMRNKEEEHSLVDLRFRLRLFLNLNVIAYERSVKAGTPSPETLERIHWYMELLKGRTLLRRLHKYNRIPKERLERLGLSVLSRVARLSDIQRSLSLTGTENPIAINACFLQDEYCLIDDQMLALIVTSKSIELRVHKPATARIASYAQAASLTEKCHALLGMREAPCRRTLISLLNLESNSEADNLNDRMISIVNEALEAANKAVETILPSERLENASLWISPAVEMSIPVGLLRSNDKYLYERAYSIVTVPIFSLGRLAKRLASEDCVVVYGSGQWKDSEREKLLKVLKRRVTVCYVEENGERSETTKSSLEELSETLHGKGIVHFVDHNESIISGETSITKLCRALWEGNRDLNVGLVFLEACCGSKIESLNSIDSASLGFAMLNAQCGSLVASPFRVFPYFPFPNSSESAMERLVGRFYQDKISIEAVALSKQLKQVANDLRIYLNSIQGGLLRLPTFWGGFEVISTLPICDEEQQNIAAAN